MVALTYTPSHPAAAPGPDAHRSGAGRDLRGHVAPDVTEVALDLHAQGSVEATLERIVTTVGLTVPCDDAGVLLVASREGASTAACTSATVERAHDLQLELDEGPCLDAIDAESGHFLVHDTATDERWPRWGPAVAALGYRSVLSIRLATLERRYGSLNLYAQGPSSFDLADLGRGVAFGRLASVALAVAQDHDGLQRAIDARRMIGIAMGILMERYDLAADPAFEVLRRYSQHHNVKLRDVARSVVEHGALPDD